MFSVLTFHLEDRVVSKEMSPHDFCFDLCWGGRRGGCSSQIGKLEQLEATVVKQSMDAIEVGPNGTLVIFELYKRQGLGSRGMESEG